MHFLCLENLDEGVESEWLQWAGLALERQWLTARKVSVLQLIDIKGLPHRDRFYMKVDESQ